ncbi:hypothetical protein BJ322DRAFT_1023120 [Thelephora terrestris]|uniref:Uncharacterized protein n=1 Tax=Thelephora terrestris TaxID=56493 RepID=A0A9P6HA52_9AGAM|nr:hypothetical protein BJ322DRAFT_1023120 [Thelephora terrestris]
MDSTPPASIFEDGKLKSGIYKIQSLYYPKFYLDIHEYTRETCCHPVENLEEGRGLWEIKPLGAGYSIRRIEPGKPEQFFAPTEGTTKGTSFFVGPYPVAWRIEVVNDAKHRGFEYIRSEPEIIRIFWGNTDLTWAVESETKDNRAKVYSWPHNNGNWGMWKFIPVEVYGGPEGPSQGPLPPYDGNARRQSSTRDQHVELEHGEFGTIVNQVTVVTTVTESTITTHKRHRIQDP